MVELFEGSDAKRCVGDEITYYKLPANSLIYEHSRVVVKAGLSNVCMLHLTNRAVNNLVRTC